MVTLKRREVRVDVDGVALILREMTAADAIAVWGGVEQAEREGNYLRLYRTLVQRCAFTEEGQAFADETVVDMLPSRVVVDLGGRILTISDVDLESDGGAEGNVLGGPREDSPIS